MLLQKANCSDEVIAAGILHDTLEDTSTTLEELVEQFGSNIAQLVRSATEQDKSLPWEKRKQHTIESLKDANLEEIQLITADKLHNLKSIQADLVHNGEKLWNRFNRGKREQRIVLFKYCKRISTEKTGIQTYTRIGTYCKRGIWLIGFLIRTSNFTPFFLCVWNL